MNLTDIQLCADFFHVNYLKTFYLVITYNENSFILLGEKANFPHLMGIQNNTYRSHGYNRPQYLFNDIIGRNPISTSIIPNHISPNSKMYKKALNFTKSTAICSAGYPTTKFPLMPILPWKSIAYAPGQTKVPVFSKAKKNTCRIRMWNSFALFLLLTTPQNLSARKNISTTVHTKNPY